MGGKSSSSSSSSTYQYDQRVGAADNGFAVGQGSDVTITDAGSVVAALTANRDVTAQVLETGQAGLEDVLLFAAGALDRASNTVSESQAQLSTTSQQALTLAEDFTRSDATEVLKDAIKWVAIGGSVYFASKFLK